MPEKEKGFVESIETILNKRDKPEGFASYLNSFIVKHSFSLNGAKNFTVDSDREQIIVTHTPWFLILKKNALLLMNNWASMRLSIVKHYRRDVHAARG